MGHASMVALGLALHHPGLKIICLDGDGALLMHLGAVATIGNSVIKNFIHVVLNNSAHDSVGGQPTGAGSMDLIQLSRACGYSKAICAKTENELIQAVSSACSEPGKYFVEVKTALRGNKEIIRPPEDLLTQKTLFVEALNKAMLPPRNKKKSNDW